VKIDNLLIETDWECPVDSGERGHRHQGEYLKNQLGYAEYRMAAEFEAE
jgi:hypothetical protein